MAEKNPSTDSVTDKDLLASAIPIDSTQVESEAEEDEFAPIEIVGGDAPPTPSSTQTREIRAFGEQQQVRHEKKWIRKPNITGEGATHIRTFCSKLRLDALEHLDQAINEWLEANPEYEVKFVSTSIGPLVGKNVEDALFVTVWV